MVFISAFCGDEHSNASKNPYPFVVSILNRNNMNNLKYGTGIIVKHQDLIYLTTAAHVAKYMREESVICICDSDLSNKTIDLVELVSSNF